MKLDFFSSNLGSNFINRKDELFYSSIVSKKKANALTNALSVMKI